MTDSRHRAETLYAAARAWRDDDPDPTTRAELDAVLARGGGAATRRRPPTSPTASSGLLEFGTAGLRGALGAGPNRMNRSVVIRAAAGLTAYLKDEGGVGESPTVVIGFDARYNSDVFARDTAAVVVAAGGRALLLPQPLPTPVLAFAIRHLGADAGVMVTASHNPPQDNGYKVYLGDGSQIVPPADARSPPTSRGVERVADVPRADDGLGDARRRPPRATTSTPSSRVVDPALAPRPAHRPHEPARRRSRHGARPPSSRPASRPRSSSTSRRCPTPTSRPSPSPTPRRRAPSTSRSPGPARWGATSSSPTTPTPTGARRRSSTRRTGDWRMLRGDEVGALLGAHIVRARRRAPRRLRQLDRVLAAARVDRRGGRHPPRGDPDRLQVDLAGRRACATATRRRSATASRPQLVRDKDGVSAALLLAELAAGAQGEGRTLTDLLDDLAVEHGVHATDSFSVRVVGPRPDRRRSWARLRAEPPTHRGRRRGRPHRRPQPRRRRAAARPRGCATSSPTARGSSSARAAPSPRSRSTSRSSSPSPTRSRRSARVTRGGRDPPRPRPRRPRSPDVPLTRRHLRTP